MIISSDNHECLHSDGKHNPIYAEVLGWGRGRLAPTLMFSVILCIRMYVCVYVCQFVVTLQIEVCKKT